MVLLYGFFVAYAKTTSKRSAARPTPRARLAQHSRCVPRSPRRNYHEYEYVIAAGAWRRAWRHAP